MNWNKIYKILQEQEWNADGYRSIYLCSGAASEFANIVKRDFSNWKFKVIDSTEDSHRTYITYLKEILKIVEWKD